MSTSNLEKSSEFFENNRLIARIIEFGDIQQGLNFYSDNDDFLQVGTWNYNAGKILDKHRHNIYERIISQTHEIVILLRGAIKVDLYDKKNNLLYEVLLDKPCFLQILDCGHGYEILEDDTRVLEVKNGPYRGPEIDRERF